MSKQNKQGKQVKKQEVEWTSKWSRRISTCHSAERSVGSKSIPHFGKKRSKLRGRFSVSRPMV